MKIDWEEFKIFKKDMPHLKGDNFVKLLYFIKSFYNIKSYTVMFDMLNNDEISSLMIEKRKIDSPLKLENFIKKNL